MTKLTSYALLVAQAHVLFERAAMIDDDVVALRAAGLKEAADDRAIVHQAALMDFWHTFKKLADGNPSVWETTPRVTPDMMDVWTRFCALRDEIAAHAADDWWMTISEQDGFKSDLWCAFVALMEGLRNGQ